ncbi:MAG: nucleotidyltransferase family protein [Chromatiales bacterium]|nr:nucleotidyltransferase family protein [Chromatiales bacterium]
MNSTLAQTAVFLGRPKPVLPDWLPAAADSLGVSALVFQRQCMPDSREPLCRRLLERDRELRAITLLRTRELARVVAALAQDTIPCLPIKGAATGQILYSQPHLRECRDTDLLVAPSAFEAALIKLGQLGYRQLPASQGKELGHAVDLVHTDPAGYIHHLDLHWRISSNPVLRETLDFDSLAQSARLGLPCRHHQFLLACMALLDSRSDSPRLTTFYDLDRLLRTLDDADCRHIVDFCRQTRLFCLVNNAVAVTRELFPGPIPPLLQALPEDFQEPARAWLSDNPWLRLWAELRYRPDRSARLAFLREHLFPPTDYLAARFHTRSRWRLALHSVGRLLDGGRKRLRPQRRAPWI